VGSLGYFYYLTKKRELVNYANIYAIPPLVIRLDGEMFYKKKWNLWGMISFLDYGTLLLPTKSY
jgi:hypothetical protein